MSPVDFASLPFSERPDLTPYLIHLTRESKVDKYTGLDNLTSILKTGRIWGSSKRGFIKGSRHAACFMDVPLAALKYVCTASNAGRYEPYGLVVHKKGAYKRGARPVVYLSNDEMADLGLPPKENWRVVRLEVSGAGWISWLHEREWRCPDEFVLPKTIPAVLVRTTVEAMLLQGEIYAAEAGEFQCVPRSVLPLEVVCQGLTLT